MSTSPQDAPHLEQLPLEIADKIFSELPDVRDRHNTSLLSSRTYALFGPLADKDLFVDITNLEKANKWPLIKLGVPTDQGAAERFGLVRGLHFRGDIRFKPARSCFHGPARTLVTAEASRILGLIPAGFVRSFSWEVGACIPAEITHYLAQYHAQISRISLITGWFCDYSRPHVRDLAYTLRSVRSISWRSPAGDDDTWSINLLIRQNADHLEELNLDFVNYKDLRESIPSAKSKHMSSFECFVLKLNCQPEAPILISLQRLSLTSISFRKLRRSTILTFNPSRLKSLTLRYCPKSGRFLNLFQGCFHKKTGACSQLQKFEYVPASPDSVESISESLCRFLLRNAQLRDLFVTFGTNNTCSRLCVLLRQFIRGLRRLVLHAEFQGTKERNWERNSKWLSHTKDLIILPELKEFGLIANARHAHQLLRNVNCASNIQFLHIRGNYRGGAHAYLHHLYDNSSPNPFLGPDQYIDSSETEVTDDSEHEGRFRSLLELQILDKIHDYGGNIHGHDTDLSSHPDPSLAVPSPNLPARHASPVCNLASWLFSNPHFSSLQIIAYGIFHHGERDDEDLQMLVRKGHLAEFAAHMEPPAVHIETQHEHASPSHKGNEDADDNFACVKMDSGLWRRLREEYRDTLDACPNRPLFVKRDMGEFPPSTRAYYPGPGW